MKLVSICGFFGAMMPTIVMSQVRAPFFCEKMLLAIGMRSPTFQPHLRASASPTSVPVRSRRKAWRASGAMSRSPA